MASDSQVTADLCLPSLRQCWWCTVVGSACFQKTKWGDHRQMSPDGQISRQIPSNLKSHAAINTKWSNCNPASKVHSSKVAAFDLVSVFHSPVFSFLFCTGALAHWHFKRGNFFNCVSDIAALDLKTFSWVKDVVSCSGAAVSWALQHLFSLKS